MQLPTYAVDGVDNLQSDLRVWQHEPNAEHHAAARYHLRHHSGDGGLQPAGMPNPRADAESDDAEPNAEPDA